MIGDNERALTTHSLNVFFETLSAELDKANIGKETKLGLFRDLVSVTLPIEENDKYGYVIDIRYKLPETINDLRKHSSYLTQSFLEDELSEDLAKIQIEQAWEKAVRAAEKSLPGARPGINR